MCAIAGTINLNVSDETITKMLESMHRRGPDGSGVYRMSEYTLLHTRLSIIDPEGGAQPMHLHWNQENFTLVYNGELYNTQEIQNKLLKLGHRFYGHSDTEVVLHAYAEWGTSCLDALNGIFAFAVLEEKKQQIFLARDRIGVKPLFYAEIEHGLIFASEIKTILCCPEIHAGLDLRGLYQIMLLGPGRCAGSGVLHGISELEPGTCALYRQGKLRVMQFWKLQDRVHEDSFETTVEKVRFLVQDSIRRQMISDVPIGTFLSGGLDSSIITAVCAKEKQKSGEKTTTFSVDYLNNDMYFKPGKFQPNADNAYINIMQTEFQTDHHMTVLSPDDLVQNLENATIARDLPGMADVDFSLLAFSGDIRRYIKVALSGECADEIFGGYPWYRDPDIRAKAGFPWSQTTQSRVELMQSSVINKQQAYDFVMDAYMQTCRESDILPENTPEERRMKEMVNLNFRWFMQTLLDRKDRMSMYHGLEVRVPFCDYRIAEYLYSVPWDMKEYRGKEKGLLRYAFRDMLPEEIVTRKKSPYPKTFDPRYEQLVTERLLEVLEHRDNPIFYFIDPQKLRFFLQQDGEWPWYGQLMRRPQTIAYFLQINFWLKHYHIDFLF